MKIAEIECGLVTRQINLRRVRSDQDPRLIRKRPVQKPISVAGTGDRQQDENLFHKAVPNLRLVEEQFRCYFWSSKQMTFETSRRIPPDHPTLAGQVPGCSAYRLLSSSRRSSQANYSPSPLTCGRTLRSIFAAEWTVAW